MSVTCDVSQLERSPSKAVAFENIDDIRSPVTCPTLEIAWLNCNLSRKRSHHAGHFPCCPVWHVHASRDADIFGHAGSWSKHISSEEQHSSPDGTASRHASTSAFNSCIVGKFLTHKQPPSAPGRCTTSRPSAHTRRRTPGRRTCRSRGCRCRCRRRR